MGPVNTGRGLPGEPSLEVCLTVAAELAPNEERFGWEYAPDEGPVDRFNPIVLWYRPEVGTGRNVGVEGREIGVGIELAVLVVAFVLMLLLPSDRRDCGRRKPVGNWLCAKALGARL